MTSLDENDHGFKAISTQNWQEADLPILFPDLNSDQWIASCLHAVTDPCVPKEVRSLVEVARASIIYGWFFYPLLTLGSEQCQRCLEAGARARCSQLGLPTSRQRKNGTVAPTTFNDHIARLAKAGIIQPAQEELWTASRKLRNRSSHPECQAVITPGMAVRTLDSSIQLLNRLFLTDPK